MNEKTGWRVAALTAGGSVLGFGFGIGLCVLGLFIPFLVLGAEGNYGIFLDEGGGLVLDPLILVVAPICAFYGGRWAKRRARRGCAPPELLTPRASSPQAELDHAQALFQDGQVVEAADVLYALRKEVDAAQDNELQAEIADVVDQMQAHLVGSPEYLYFNRHLRKGKFPAGLPAAPSSLGPPDRVFFWRLGLVLGAVATFFGGFALGSNSCESDRQGIAFLIMLIPAVLVSVAVGITDGETSTARWVAATVVGVTLTFVLIVVAAVVLLAPCT
ncbi:MAG TPA: hypothetical protein VI159_10935 [Gemmatimonadales bacterium]